MTLEDFIQESERRLKEGNLHFSHYKDHASQLVLRTLDLNPTQFFLKKNDKLNSSELEKLNHVLQRRLSGEPLQYILGFEYFYESKFEVGPGCLIPRKETEQLVDEVLAHQPPQNLKVAELGAGSGNIGISVLLKRPKIHWHAFEINPKSAQYAKKNIRDLLPGENNYFLHGEDFFSGIKRFSPFDLLVSNPPYISSREFEELPLEVRQEPDLALKAGEEGLDVIRKLIGSLSEVLKPGGLFLCEIASSQGELLKSELGKSGKKFEVLRDLAGLPRILKLDF
ncbi:peptide chain release factor N(5)-glutamine methyltransferase [bacterium]|nr:peptide chain release factor N(5)-glutamine methyltransferase [bacterium]